MIRKAIQFSVAAGMLCTAPVFAQTGQHAPGSLDMTNTKDPTPSEYAVLPLARGQKQDASSDLVGEEVKGKGGEVRKLFGSEPKLCFEAVHQFSPVCSC